MEQSPLAGLVGYLTDPQDRETYAALISYFHSLPPGDELSRLAQLLGFLSLLGQRLPDALAEFLQALREHTAAAEEYRAKVDARLARLPKEIAAGVDPTVIAKAMSETFRQQIAAVGLQDTARLLGTSVAGLQKISGELSARLRTITDQYAGIGATISRELTKLTNASAQLRQHNTGLAAEVAEARWRWKAALCVVLLCVGFIAGLMFEKRGTVDAISGFESRIFQIQQNISEKDNAVNRVATASAASSLKR